MVQVGSPFSWIFSIWLKTYNSETLSVRPASHAHSRLIIGNWSRRTAVCGEKNDAVLWAYPSPWFRLTTAGIYKILRLGGTRKLTVESDMLVICVNDTNDVSLVFKLRVGNQFCRATRTVNTFRSGDYVTKERVDLNGFVSPSPIYLPIILGLFPLHSGHPRVTGCNMLYSFVRRRGGGPAVGAACRRSRWP